MALARSQRDAQASVPTKAAPRVLAAPSASRSVKAGATFIAYVLVQRKGSRRLLFQCMAEPFEMWRCGVRGHGMLKAKRGERCAGGATVRVVCKLIDWEKALAIDQKVVDDWLRRQP